MLSINKRGLFIETFVIRHERNDTLEKDQLNILNPLYNASKKNVLLCIFATLLTIEIQPNNYFGIVRY